MTCPFKRSLNRTSLSFLNSVIHSDHVSSCSHHYTQLQCNIRILLKLCHDYLSPVQILTDWWLITICNLLTLIQMLISHLNVMLVYVKERKLHNGEKELQINVMVKLNYLLFCILQMFIYIFWDIQFCGLVCFPLLPSAYPIYPKNPHMCSYLDRRSCL